MKRTHYLFLAAVMAALVWSCSEDVVSDSEEIMPDLETEEPTLELGEGVDADTVMVLDTIPGYCPCNLYQYKVENGQLHYYKILDSTSSIEPFNWYSHGKGYNQFIQFNEGYATVYEWNGITPFYKKYFVDYRRDESTGKLELGLPFEMVGLEQTPRRPFVAQVVEDMEQYGSDALVLDADFICRSCSISYGKEATHSRVILRAGRLLYRNIPFETFDYRSTGE